MEIRQMRFLFSLFGLLIATNAVASSPVSYKVAFSSDAKRNLTLRTSQRLPDGTWENKETYYGATEIRRSNCDSDWRCKKEDKGSSEEWYEVKPSPDGIHWVFLRIRAAYEDSGIDRLWILGPGGWVEPIGLTTVCQDLSWSSDGKRLIAATGKVREIYDLSTGHKIYDARPKDLSGLVHFGRGNGGCSITKTGNDP